MCLLAHVCGYVCVCERVDSDREIERETDERDQQGKTERQKQRLSYYHISKELNLLPVFTEKSILYTKSKNCKW